MNYSKTYVAIVILLLCSTDFRADDRLTFYWGNTAIDYKSGISLAEIRKSNGAEKLRYVIREDLIQEIAKRNTKIKVNLIRGGVSLYTFRENKVLSGKTLDVQRIFSSVRAGDTILIELQGVAGVLPQIVGIHITE